MSATDETWPEYVVTYRFNGAPWGLTIPARNSAEASRRLRAIGMTGTVDGELVMTIPAGPAAGLLTRAICFARNLFGEKA